MGEPLKYKKANHGCGLLFVEFIVQNCNSIKSRRKPKGARIGVAELSVTHESVRRFLKRDWQTSVSYN